MNGAKRAKMFGELALLAVVVSLLLLRLLVYRPVQVVQNSMEPTLQQGDKLLVNTWRAKDQLPPRGAIVVLVPPGETDWVVKRVIGVDNDEVLIGPAGLRLNGKPIREDYISQQAGDATSGGTVPRDSIYVLGDNRPYSNDSRDFGPVPRENLIGVAVWVLSPATHRRPLKPAPALAGGN